MPLYEYTCPRCGEKREVLSRSADAAAAPECPVCSSPMEKAWSTVACHTKASGVSCGGGRGGFS
ncbi:MAG: zinc ribbon domain-containing protein [Deltaproteobacteria bacterium]|nr:zinc ribbon domain-containing protein [Deltaproteobacteria bacterium]